VSGFFALLAVLVFVVCVLFSVPARARVRALAAVAVVLTAAAPVVLAAAPSGASTVLSAPSVVWTTLTPSCSRQPTGQPW
jgi:hypothetical protein